MVSDKYEPQQVEAKWQRRWKEADLFRTLDKTDKPKFYGLDFFPYPSGAGLSVGHCRNYIPTDVACRYRRMKGYNVLHPMGWDAFGLPAENEAIKQKSHPKRTVPEYIATYKRQMELIGIGYDWSREINSSQPDYYKWTQWIFLLLYKRGLAYRSLAPANWCPSCATVLANEEVKDSRCWRCSSFIEKKGLPQWFFKITDYADRLIDDLETIDWPESIKLMQKNWIGRSEGVEFDMVIAGSPHQVRVYTTRPDTVFGVTYMVLAPEHPLVEVVTAREHQSAVQAYREQARTRSELERVADVAKDGVFTGAYAINPMTGERVAVWTADYVLMGYGTGAIMAVPAHDQRDFEFARRHDLPMRVVIQPPGIELSPQTMTDAYVEPGIQVNSGRFDGMPSAQAWQAIADDMERRGIGKRTIHYRLRDWLISRQRYWGAPIPIIHCENCGEVPVPEQDLPVVLPDVEQYEPTGGGESPLAAIPEFVNVTCPTCGAPAKRETDTMGGFACSSWYFLRYVSPHLDTAAFDKDLAAYWLPVDLYVGGAEHAVMHLLYARFWTKVLYDAGLVPFAEPFAKLMNQGMVLAHTPHRTMEAGETIEVEADDDEGARDLIPLFPEEAEKLPPQKVIWKFVKMSKSKRNVVTPDAMTAKYGADALRTYELFVAPFEDAVQWNEDGMSGAFRFMGRVWRLVNDWDHRFDPDWRSKVAAEASSELRAKALRRKTHQTTRKVGEDIGRMHFNTAIAALMELVNQMADFASGVSAASPPGDRAALSEAMATLPLLLSPFAPHLADELAERLGLLGDSVSLLSAPWPAWDEEVAREVEVTVVVQVNGRVRDRLTVAAGTADERLKELALQSDRAKAFIAGKAVRNVVVVPDKLVNIVAG